MKLNTREEVQEFLNNHFDDEFQHWEVDTRIIWIYQASNGTGRYQSQKNLNYGVIGILGKPVEVEVDPSGSLTFSKQSTFKRKPYTTFTTISKTEDGGYILIKYVGFLYNTFLENMDNMRGNSSYNKAVEMSGIENPTDEEIATTMATQIYGLRKDAPEIDPNTVTLDVHTEMVDGKLEITGDFRIAGEPSNPLRWMWWVNPAEGVLGTASSGKAAGEYIGGRKKFTVNSDFRDRESFMIMNTKDVEIKCYAQYKEQDGDLKMKSKFVTIDLTGALPLYDYFGLVGK